MGAPRMTSSLELIQEIETARQLPLYAKRDIALVRGEGAYLYDTEGRRYLDAMSNYGVAVLGHADREYQDALTDQLGTLTTCHQSFYNDVRATALAAIAAELPSERRQDLPEQLRCGSDRISNQVRASRHWSLEDRCCPPGLPRADPGGAGS